MPKAKWGAGDAALTADDINNAEVVEPRVRYSGELPPPGTYRWTIEAMQKAESSNGNDKVVIRMSLDGDWQPNHKKYNGCPVWHHLALTKANAQQVRNFLDAIGGTSADLLNNTIVDENGYISKLGRVNDPVGLQVFATIQNKKTSKEYPNPGIEVAYAGYIMVEDGDESGGDAADGDDDGGDAPF